MSILEKVIDLLIAIVSIAGLLGVIFIIGSVILMIIISPRILKQMEEEKKANQSQKPLQ